MQDSHDILSSSLITLSLKIKDLHHLVDTIQLPPHLPPLSHSADSLHHSKSQTYTTHPEKQDYHAHHLALLLTSLAQHYDQTSSALKEHDNPLIQATAPLDPETLEILSRDASEVAEVLEEMEDHVREIEHSSDILQTHSLTVSQTYETITNTFSQIEAYGRSRLPTHLASVRDFEAQAGGHREHIGMLKGEMFNLVEYYTKFTGAYAALLGEVRRRQESAAHTTFLVNEIAAKFASLLEQEVSARQGFMDLHAAFLPEDLWRGILDPPARVTVHTEEGGVLPVLREGKRLSSVGMEKRRSMQGVTGQMGGSGESGGRRSVESSGRRSGESSIRRGS
jgi:autophagy-related protein 17